MSGDQHMDFHSLACPSRRKKTSWHNYHIWIIMVITFELLVPTSFSLPARLRDQKNDDETLDSFVNYNDTPYNVHLSSSAMFDESSWTLSKLLCRSKELLKQNYLYTFGNKQWDELKRIHMTRQDLKTLCNLIDHKISEGRANERHGNYHDIPYLGDTYYDESMDCQFVAGNSDHDIPVIIKCGIPESEISDLNDPLPYTFQPQLNLQDIHKNKKYKRATSSNAGYKTEMESKNVDLRSYSKRIFGLEILDALGKAVPTKPMKANVPLKNHGPYESNRATPNLDWPTYRQIYDTSNNGNNQYLTHLPNQNVQDMGRNQYPEPEAAQTIRRLLQLKAAAASKPQQVSSEGSQGSETSGYDYSPTFEKSTDETPNYNAGSRDNYSSFYPLRPSVNNEWSAYSGRKNLQMLRLLHDRMNQSG